MREFVCEKAEVRDLPLLLALMGPPGGGKTRSALRLADGMRRVRGGKPVVIDTEGGRSRVYASLFDFEMIPFDPPYPPGDFWGAIQKALSYNPCAVIVDNMSDEHEGEGGVLDWHSKNLDRMAGNDYSKRDRMTQAAWIEPKRARTRLIGNLLRVTTPIIFCFRAREKTKQIKDERGKMVPTNIGYQPIAPLEIMHAMTASCLLPAKAEGVPVWRSDNGHEDFVLKCPDIIADMLNRPGPLTEDLGELLARWARGETVGQPQTQAAKPPAMMELEGVGEFPRTGQGAKDALDALAAAGPALILQHREWIEGIAAKVPSLAERCGQVLALAQAATQPAAGDDFPGDRP